MPFYTYMYEGIQYYNATCKNKKEKHTLKIDVHPEIDTGPLVP